MLGYSYISEEDIAASVIPPRRPNGGLDTGRQASGPWGSVDVMPDPVSYSRNLLNNHTPPPPRAERQPTTFERPGNNNVQLPYHTFFDKDVYTLRCLT
jgi:hypothetical protein